MDLSNEKNHTLLFIVVILTSSFCFAKTTPGLEYRKVTTENKQVIHILEVDPKQVDIKLIRAKNFHRSRETVVDIANHYHALAAINGGFFRVNEKGDGFPAGLLKIKNHLYGIAYSTRAAIGWSNKENVVLIDRVQTKTTVNVNQHILPINGMNLPLTTKRTILYSDSYDDNQLYFEDDATHFIINNNKIVDIKTQNNVTIPANGYVYSAGSNMINKLPKIAIGEPTTINSKLIPLLSPTTAEIWNKLPFILSGTPLLLKNGSLIKDYETEKLTTNFINNPYARTAIGILHNGNWLLAVAEKNTRNNTTGLSIPELASVMQDLGCNNALNLDGGGSSTMYFNNKVVNFPEGDEDESLGIATIRKVSDAIVLVEKDLDYRR